MDRDKVDVSVGQVAADGHARVHVGNVYNSAGAPAPNDQLDQQYVEKLRSTDPRDDKARIEELKGGLLEGACQWVLQAPEFISWRDDRESQMLWIKGDPGKGKTMLLCSIINALEPSTKLRSGEHSHLLSYFFCQATNSGLNNTTAVLKGLIYLLVVQQPSLISYIREKNPDFNNWNSRVSLTNIFNKMLEDRVLDNSYLIIDAMDECTTDLDYLLKLITASSSSKARWIISSRNRSDIQEHLEFITQRVSLSLEINEKSISEAVNIYISHKVDQLSRRKGCDEATRSSIENSLVSRAHGTFLWVALVCQELSKCPPWELLECIQEYPPGLDALYERMMNQIQGSRSHKLFNRILAFMLTVYRPITSKELFCIEEIPDRDRYFLEVISNCGSFLTVREDTVDFIHKSAKDYLLEKQTSKLFPDGIAIQHHMMVEKAFLAMGILAKDVYGLVHPGLNLDEAISVRPSPDPLIGVRYSCVYWVDHLSEANYDGYLRDDGLVYRFLMEKFLFWLEALSLTRDFSVSSVTMAKLEKLLVSSGFD